MLSMVLGFLNIGTSELLFIAAVVLILFGGKKFPELARGLGRGIREFKDASDSIKRDISDQINNFEKDLTVTTDTKSEDTKPKEITSAADKPAPKTFSAPEGTYQHNPGKEPDYYGSEGEYYSDYGYQADNSATDKVTVDTGADTDSPMSENQIADAESSADPSVAKSSAGERSQG